MSNSPNALFSGRVGKGLARVCLGLLVLTSHACGGGTSGSETAPPVTPSSLDSYPPSATGTSPGASAEALATTKRLGQGINFGNMLEGPNEGDWGLRVEQRFIDLVGKNSDGNPGLTNSVRLPVRWSNHASSDAQAVIDPAFFTRVDAVVDALLARGATVILDMHHYHQLEGDALDPGERNIDTAGDNNLLRVRMLTMWQQIATRYAKKPPQLLFEIYNEPHGSFEVQWNDMLSRALRVIRTSNPTRLVVVGPTLWNSPTRLSQLVLPPDANLILTVHHYEPFEFTHQGADWIKPFMPAGVDCCTPAMTKRMTDLLDTAVTESKRLGYPVFVGEFGSYEKGALPARERYLGVMRSEMTKRQLPWFYWELASGFGLYDPVAGAYRKELKDALFGP
jgi:endoglucanase